MVGGGEDGDFGGGGEDGDSGGGGGGGGGGVASATVASAAMTRARGMDRRGKPKSRRVIWLNGVSGERALAIMAQTYTCGVLQNPHAAGVAITLTANG